jgi:Transposase DDE domain
MVQCHVRALEAKFNGVIRALAKAGVFGKQVTGMADGTDVETTKRDADCGQATRTVHIQDKRGQVHESEVTVYGWKMLILIDAATKMPLAVKVGKIEAHETHWTRALVTQARTNLAGVARLHQVVFDRGFWEGSDLWWLDQQGIHCVEPGPSPPKNRAGRAGAGAVHPAHVCAGDRVSAAM